MIIQAAGVAGQGTAAEWLAAQGITVDEPILDGRIHRGQHSCSPTGSEAAWYWAETDPVPHGACGCWRCGHRANWATTPGGSLTDDQRRAIRERAAARESELEAQHDQCSKRLTELRRSLEFAPPEHPYLQAKGVQPCGALIHGEDLILPLQDVDGRIWSAEGIAPAPKPEWGGRTKSFESGSRTAGCFFAIGNVAAAEKVLIAEGFATGATLHVATGLPVACAMYAGNLKAVTAAIRAKNPAASVIVCADNDRHTADNPGVTKAEEAALTLACEIAIPQFPPDAPPAPGASDWNDLARIKGIDAVRDAILAVIPRDRPPVIYDAGRANWWTKNSRGEFIIAGESGARRRLRANGLSSKQGRDELLSPVDFELVRLLHEDSVEYAGPVAGWPVGVHHIAGRRILVTSSSTVLPGGPGDCGTLVEIFRRMLGEEQCRRFVLWLVCARRRLTTRRWHPLPALALVGPRACGKSLAQHVTTLLLGGRSAKPAQYLQGLTPFNGDLFGAEHLTFEDESARADNASRRHLGEQIKTMLFCRQVQCHAKHRQAITLEPTWALSISLNHEAEHMMVFPPIDDSLADKILLLACEHHPRPVPPEEEETQWLRGVIERELPAFADMLDKLRPEDFPENIRDARTIVAGWQNRIVLAQMRDLSPEAQLLQHIDDTLFATPAAATWRGSAEQLSKELRTGPFGPEATRLLSWPTACGVYLGRLAAQHPHRVEKVTSRTREDGRAVKWTIHAPIA